MTNATLRGKPDAGNPHVRFDEGEVAPAKPGRGSLLYKKFTALLVLLGCAAFATSAAVTITDGTEKSRPSGFPKSASGITYAGGDTYYIVADNATASSDCPLEVGLYKATLQFAADGKTITNAVCGSRIELTMTSDLEACAFDPASGNVWCADEAQKTIKEYDPTTGAIVRTLDVPAVMKNIQGNYGFESLTISGDGLTMWTANEESLTVDGPRSSYTTSATNRLVKFTRPTVTDDWHLAAMYPYVTDKWTQQYGYGSAGRRGISDLCALPDGSLLVMERELSTDTSGTGFMAGLGVSLYYSIYCITPAAMVAATDVKDFASLKNGGWTKVAKGAALRVVSAGWRNFEGLCFGKRLSNNTCELVMLTDAGDGNTSAVLKPCVLSGLDVVTVNFTAPSEGTVSQVGSNYRYLNGSTITSTITGEGINPSAYTNNGVKVVSAAMSGATVTGTTATKTLTGDFTMDWKVEDRGTATTEIGSNDSFEGYAVGATEIVSWTGYGEVEAADYSTKLATPPGYPMPKETHTKVLNAEDSAVRAFSSNIAGNRHLDVMTEVRRPKVPLEDGKAGERVRVCVDPDGYMCLWHLENGTNRWTRLSETAYANGDWVRIGIDLEDLNGESFCRVKLNGSVCPTAQGVREPANPTAFGPWYRIPSDTAAKMASVEFIGTRVDDLLVTTDKFPAEQSGPTATNGIAFTWFDEAGLPRDPTAAAPNLPGKTVQYLHDSGVDPYGDEVLTIKNVELAADGTVRMKFNGYKGDHPEAGYRIIRSTDLKAWTPLTSAEGSFNADRTTWSSTWEGIAPVTPDLNGFFKVEAVPTAK